MSATKPISHTNACASALPEAIASIFNSPEFQQKLQAALLNSASIPLPRQTKTTAAPLNGFLRLPQIIGDPKAIPPIPALIPVGKSNWWAGVKSGRYPPAIRLSPRVTVWRAADIAAFLANPNGKGEA
jgi:predicted DNA-binding transcriptional regulator AlpA